jgi:hypothetical protein
MLINNELCEIIQEQIILGYTLPELAEAWGVSSTNLTNKYFLIKNKKKYIPKVINVEMSGKQRPYYENEDNYGKLPTYTFAELSKKEKEIFLNLNKQQTNETK